MVPVFMSTSKSLFVATYKGAIILAKDGSPFWGPSETSCKKQACAYIRDLKSWEYNFPEAPGKMCKGVQAKAIGTFEFKPKTMGKTLC